MPSAAGRRFRGNADGAGLPGDGFADGGDYLGGPAGLGQVGRGVVGAAVDEAGRVVLEDGGGELVDPLPDGAADPAAVIAPGGGEGVRVCQARGESAAGSSASRACSNVVPERGNPITKMGRSIFSRAMSG